MKLSTEQMSYLKDLLVWVRLAANGWIDKEKYDIEVGPLFDITQGIRISEIRSVAGKKGGRPKRNEVAAKKVKLEKKVVTKLNYAPFVTLTEAENEELVTKYGQKVTTSCIEALNHYKQSSGKTYSSDYGAINSWVLNKVLPAMGLTKETASAKSVRKLPAKPEEKEFTSLDI